MNHAGEAVSHVEDRPILGTSMFGVPKLAPDLDRADRNGKAVAQCHSESNLLLECPLTFLGSIVPKIPQDPGRPDRNEKAVPHAEGHHILGTSILGPPGSHIPEDVEAGLVTKWHDVATAARHTRSWKREAHT